MIHFAHNLKSLRKDRKYTQAGLSSKLGITRGQFAKYEEGRSEPRFEVLRQMAEAFDISVDALLNQDLSINPSGPQQEREIFPITVEEDGKDLIEVVPMDATAGYLSGYGDPEYIESLKRMKLPFVPSGKHRAFPIRGDSMYPVQDGSYIVGRHLDRLDRIRDGRTYIIVSREDGITYKRVWNEVEENGKLLLVPDNKLYHSYRINASSVMEVWEYVCNINTSEYEEADLNYDSIMQMLRSMNVKLTDLYSWMEEMKGQST